MRVAVFGAAFATAIVVVTPAHADNAPTGSDVVGVGSDVVQYGVDFVADGDTTGHAGYNSTGNVNRLVNFDAVADANGRNSYVGGTATALNSTVVLREGTSPVQRPNGGSAGISALLADGATDEISYVRSPNLPTSAQRNLAKGPITATSGLGSDLHVVQIATDTQVIATATTTNAPSALSLNELVGIYNGTYKHWNELPGNSAGSADAIIPQIPQAGAGVRNTFLNALTAANGGTAITLASNVVSVEQNDPTTITTLPAAQQVDAIVPFPTSRNTLYAHGYFFNPSVPFPGSATPLTSGVKLLSGTAGDGAAAASIPLPYYIIFRDTDAASTTPWQPGSTLNWVQALFSNPGSLAKPYFNTSAGKALITSSGATPLYNDLGTTY
ncbi:hypothetical protein SAMN05444157_3517 [Frankineae bacterium MT45]|nr:hypothetical protein SAMN05444157_3517 [Frankineae bacterium MT45]